MKLRKRRNLDEVAEETLGKDWIRVTAHPTLAGIHYYCEDRTAAQILSLLNQAKAGGRFIGMSLEDKLYVYFFCSIMWRGLGRSLLTDPQYNLLQRHLWSSSVVDKIEAFSVNLHYHGTFMWDMPDLAKRYKKPGIMPLPPMPKPKKKLKRLPKHMKQR